jgi:hypothetical protein
MSKVFVTVFWGSFLALLVNGCSALQIKDETSVTIKPSKLHEECMEMMPGDALLYSFKTSNPVDFNIHYHEAGNIIYPVSQKNSSGEQGKFSAVKEQTYCLMWTNVQPKPVNLTYTFTVKKKVKPTNY